MLIKMFHRFDWPKETLEWIIVDDGTDKVGDLFPKDDPQIKYFAIDQKMTLGAKRNFMHGKARGDFIVYMDDDDYYPPTRIRHAVESLQKNPDILIAGSSVIHVFYRHLGRVMEFGPYAPYHATAGTFAFRKELLLFTRYQDNACLAEEKFFLKNYTIPMLQLDPLHTILVFAHRHNTFDKKKLLKTAPNAFTHETNLLVRDFIENGDIQRFFEEDLETILAQYPAGEPAMKPDVIHQTNEMDKQRIQSQQQLQQLSQSQQQQSQMQQQSLNIPQVGQTPTIREAIQIIQNNERVILQLQEKCRHEQTYIQQQTEYIAFLKQLLEKAEVTIPFREKPVRKSAPERHFFGAT